MGQPPTAGTSCLARGSPRSHAHTCQRCGPRMRVRRAAPSAVGSCLPRGTGCDHPPECSLTVRSSSPRSLTRPCLTSPTRNVQGVVRRGLSAASRRSGSSRTGTVLVWTKRWSTPMTCARSGPTGLSRRHQLLAEHLWLQQDEARRGLRQHDVARLGTMVSHASKQPVRERAHRVAQSRRIQHLEVNPSRARLSAMASSEAAPAVSSHESYRSAPRSPWQARPAPLHSQPTSPAGPEPDTGDIRRCSAGHELDGVRRVHGANSHPVAVTECRRSTRKLRQSSRSTSRATRYQRRPVLTSRCGSTRRSVRVPSWLV